MMKQGEVRRWRSLCAYDGTEFAGWQSQAGGQTIQDFIEARLAVVFGREVRIHGSGRTDAGVHAKGQVFHFDAVWAHPTEALDRALRVGVPAGIQIVRTRPVPPDFHARFSARGKRYVYRIYEGQARPWESRYCWSLGRRRLALEPMRLAAKGLLGYHDFAAFSARRGDGSDGDSTWRTLRRLDILARGRHLRIVTEADGYLYKMVRRLVGGLVEVGLGRQSPEALVALLEEKEAHRLETAPAHGLWLDRVFY